MESAGECLFCYICSDEYILLLRDNYSYSCCCTSGRLHLPGVRNKKLYSEDINGDFSFSLFGSFK